MNYPSDKPPFLCPYCDDNSFPTRQERDVHLAEEHTTKDKIKRRKQPHTKKFRRDQDIRNYRKEAQR